MKQIRQILTINVISLNHLVLSVSHTHTHVRERESECPQL